MLQKDANLERMYQYGFRPSHALWVDTYNKCYGSDVIFTIVAGINDKNHYYVSVEL